MSHPAANTGQRGRRWLFWGVPGFLAVLVAGLWFGPAQIDWSPLKPRVEALIERQLGADLSLKGGMQLRILPQPEITLAAVDLDGPGAKGHIRWVRGRLDAAALVLGKIEPRDLILVEPDLAVPFGQDPEEGFKGDTRVTIENATLRFDGAPDWLPSRLERLNGVLRLGGTAAPRFNFDGDGRLGDQPIGLSVEGRTGGTLTLSLRHAPSASDLVLTATPDGLGGWGGKAALVMEETGFLSTLRAEAISRLLGSGAATLDATFTLDAAGRLGLTVSDITGSRLSGSGGFDILPGEPRTHLLRGALDSARWDQDDTPSPRRLIRDVVDGLSGFRETLIEFDLNIGSLTLPEGEVRTVALHGTAFDGLAHVTDFTATLPGGTVLQGHGDLEPMQDSWRFDGHIAMNSQDLRRGLSLFSLDQTSVLQLIPADRLRFVSLSSDILATPDRLDLTALEGQFDDSRFDGAVSWQREGDADLVLQVDRINLDRYPGAIPLLRDRAAGSEMMPLSGRAALYFGSMVLEGVPISGLTLNLERQSGTESASGGLTMTAQAEDLAGASGSVHLSVSPSGQSEGGLSLSIPEPDRMLGAIGVPARQAARFASFGATEVQVDLSGSPAAGLAFAAEALGRGGDVRLKGTAAFLPSPALTISDGDLDWDGWSAQDIAATCTAAGSDWHCEDMHIALPGTEISARATLRPANAGRKLDLAIVAAKIDLERLIGGLSLPVHPQGAVRGEGVLSGEGPDPVSALLALSGKLDLDGQVALVLDRGNQGYLGNLDRLRDALDRGFSGGAPLNGTLTLDPARINATLQAQGKGLTAAIRADYQRSAGQMNARIDLLEPGAATAAASITAEGGLKAPRVRMSGPLISGN